MADVKVEDEATVASSITGTEVSYIVQDPSGTPAPAQVTKAVEKAYYNASPIVTGITSYDLTDAGNKTGSYTLPKTYDSVKVTATGTVTLVAPASATAGDVHHISIELAASGGDQTINLSGFVDNTGLVVTSGQSKYCNYDWNGTAWVFFGDIKAADIAAALAAPGAIGGTTPAAITGTTIQANTGFVPDANDGAYLGTTALGFSDLFLASGAVLNFANADLTMTHSSATMTGTGTLVWPTIKASTNLSPNASDGAALGTTALQWSDLFLAEGGVINWDNGDVTVTQTGNVLAIAGTTSVTVEGAAIKVAGKESLWIPASAMKPAATTGAATGTYESTTNKVNLEVLDFDGAADEYAWFTVAFPKSWNESTVTFQAFWFSTATDTDACIWGLAGVAVSDNETLDVALGTAITVTDNAQSAANELYVSAESSAITIAGTPAEGDGVLFRVFRDADAGGDTLAEDARLLGIKLFFTTNAANDA
jgi:hypothetical protein